MSTSPRIAPSGAPLAAEKTPAWASPELDQRIIDAYVEDDGAGIGGLGPDGVSESSIRERARVHQVRRALPLVRHPQPALSALPAALSTFAPLRSPVARRHGWGDSLGKVTVNVEPSPVRLWTPIVPPWASTSCRTIHRPRPKPSWARCETSRSKRSKMRA